MSRPQLDSTSSFRSGQSEYLTPTQERPTAGCWTNASNDAHGLGQGNGNNDDNDDDDASPSSSSAEAQFTGREAEPGRQDEPGAKDLEPSSTLPGQPPTQFHRLLRHLAILGLLAFAAIWGTLTRLGLVALNTYDGSSITPVIWAQAVGCLVMGWTIANKAALELWYPPAFVMLGTGYCGSVTTFSTWILEVFEAYSNEKHYNRHGLHNVMDALTQSLVTLGMSFIALKAGTYLARALPASLFLDVLDVLVCRRPVRREPGRRQDQANTSSANTAATTSDDRQAASSSKSSASHPAHPIPNVYPPMPKAVFSSSPRPQPLHQRSNPRHTPMVDAGCFALGLLFWIGAALFAGLDPSPRLRPVTLSIVFGPFGAIARWYLSQLNSWPASKRLPYWPLGTFTANLSATVLIALFSLLMKFGRSSNPITHTLISCQVLYALQEGLCGCLSTISTFAVELYNLKNRRWALGYALGSYALGILACVLFLGVPWWTRGLEGSCQLVMGSPMARR